jgi:phosphoglucosamine mutase
MGSIFGTDGIRDRAGQGWLSPANVRRIGRAAGFLLSRDPALFRTPLPARLRRLRTPTSAKSPARRCVVIGRDPRASGPGIERALAEGLAEHGVAVVSAGVVSTPGVAYLARRWGALLGIVISASHNPAGDNGIKLISPQGFKVPDAAETALEEILRGGDPPAAGTSAPRPRDASRRVSEYLDFLAGFSRPLKGMRIVADCGHGAASALAGPLLRRLGARAVILNASPDGRNINRGCGALHPEGLSRVVRREKADAGVAFDGDADRAIFVDETGEVRDGEHVLALAGVQLRRARRLPGGRVVSTVMANFGLERHLAAHGISLVRTRVGDRYVAEEMLASGAVLGGEPSGHVLFYDASPAGDGLLTALRVFDLLRAQGRRFSETAFAKFPQVLLNVRVARKPPLESAPGVAGAVRRAEAELGADGRVLVRYSGTEPLCRVMVEGPRRDLVERLSRTLAGVVEKELA